MIERIYLTRREQLRKYVAERRMAAKAPRTQIEIATILGMGDKQFGQLVAEPIKEGKKNKGWRPISIEAARDFEAKLDLPEFWLDGENALAVTVSVSDEPPASESFAESRRKNDVLALRHAMMGLALTLRRREPETAAEAARGAVVQSGLPFAKQGFLNVLICTLLGVEQMSEADLDALLRQPISQGSSRRVSGTRKA